MRTMFSYLAAVALHLCLLQGKVSLVSGCSGRQVLNATKGNITDGLAKKYPKSSYCEWLIDGGQGKSIQLDFISMETECSYDYLFIYDGNSYSSPLLGSYSGNTVPDPIVAKSGYMLIYFFSDRNYVQNGFVAKYVTSECPWDCSKHGTCDPNTHKCTCNNGFTGEGCEIPQCVDDCGSHGTCNMATFKCECEDGYSGYSCTFPTNSSEQSGNWFTLSPKGTGLSPRTGHAGSYVSSTNSFYVFGGSNLNIFHDDLVRYDFAQNEWKVLPKTLPWPEPRYRHAIVEHAGKLYMFGGVLKNEIHSNELWAFDVTTGFWSQAGALNKPPGVSSHTLTLVEDAWLYLFGGRLEDGNFTSSIYRINLQDLSAWEAVVPRGGKQDDRRLVGHSTVYHAQSKSLLVYGGFQPDYARFPKRTNFLHAFHIEKNMWSRIHYNGKGDSEQPKERAFHTAAIMGNYMVIYGGNAHIHHHEEICYDSEIYFYHLGCHVWVRYNELSNGQRTNFKGRFSHVAVPAFGNTLLVSGGYRGNPLGDLMAYTVPIAIAKNEHDHRWNTSSDHCPLHRQYDTCNEDPECVWCANRRTPPTPGCVHRSKAKDCDQQRAIQSGVCPGICSTLLNCSSCAVFGEGASPVPNSVNKGLWENDQCAWCVKEAKCQSIGEYRGACNTSEGTTSGIDGWWGKNSSRLTNIDQCRRQDYPAGLHLIKYRPPADYSHPDEVEIVRETRKNFMYDPATEEVDLSGMMYIVMFRGYLHPLGAPSYNEPPLKVFLVSSGAHAKLNISTDDKLQNEETVAELDLKPFDTQEATRPDGRPIFLNEGRGYKYFMEQVALQEIAGPKGTQVASIIQLDWTGALKDTIHIRHPFTSEFLEPYNNGECDKLMNCMACMTDTACGWCPTNQKCTRRDATGLSSNACGTTPGAHQLILDATECPICRDHLSCHSCSSDERCEWLASEVKCFRRGRFDNAITEAGSCPLPCQERTNCSWCVSEQNECAWCEETQTCFPFVEYIIRYSYGGCMQWIDSMSLQKCHDCSRHTTCQACQAEFQCGWCGNDDNPTIGVCMHGDFPGPDPAGNCSVMVAAAHNTSETDPASWSYGVCPDVEECRLGLDDCHENASCINTFDSYVCECNRGFTGDGQNVCDRTCYYDCAHGRCSGPPDFQCLCDIGWMGEECNTNCGCNNHSTCINGINQCDECQDWTTGTYCEICEAGSYGDATTVQGCVPCDCNGHGDARLGVCNSTTGKCHCKDNTEGDHCQRCKEGFYGDPRGGAKCYLKCDGRSILGNVTTGALGSWEGRGVERKSHAYCLWILTIHPNLNELRILDILPTITFTMEADIKTECSKDYVYVYDGIPGFMISNGESTGAKLLATYCGHNFGKPPSVEAKTGYLTVYFEGSIEQSTSTRGFNASFHVNSCPVECRGNHVCDNNRCVCKDGYGGVDCAIELCPLNCSDHLGQGRCDLVMGQCVCSPGFAGAGCGIKLPENTVVYTNVFDPQRVSAARAVNSSIARMGHTIVTCDESTLYMFGGYSLGIGVLNDLWKFDIATNEWSEVHPSNAERPSPRYFHSAVCVPAVHAIYIFGGLLSDTGSATDELWKFNLDSHRWSKLEINNVEGYRIPAMAGHSMTLLGDDGTKACIIGGFSVEFYYSNSTYEYDIAADEWREMSVTGIQPVGLYGHSSVFHKQSNSIYVFGGMEYQTDRNQPSSNVYALDLKKYMWNILQSEPGNRNRPLDRYFHSAITTDSYMVIIGGRTSHSDFDHTVMAYRYKCNKWMDLTPEGRKTDHIADGSKIYGFGIPSAIGQAAVMANKEIYVSGGFSSVSGGTLVKIALPLDLCTLQTELYACLNSSGCSACTVQETNKTYCYSKDLASRPEGCLVENTTISIHEGITCDKSRVENPDFCSTHDTCAKCLAQWPIHRGHEKICKWCSNCHIGKCIPKTADCKEDNPCQRVQTDMTKIGTCVDLSCLASDCDKCWSKKMCMWTRQFKRSSEVGRTLSLVPMYNWNCVARTLLGATPYKLKITSSPPKECPIRCYQHTSCESCLESLGSEGGDQKCEWSVQLQQCMPPAYRPLRCANGECGHMLVRSQSASPADQCPRKCSIHQQCSTCLETPGCGWCAHGPINGLDGIGVCMEGGLVGPLNGLCTAQNISLGNEPLPSRLLSLLNSTTTSTAPPTWNFGKCPPENECLNGHHTCAKNEDCTNLEEDFKCDCKSGFKRADLGKCKPVCRQGCASKHGTCVDPDVCKCHFGYVGHNCSTECKCNKHSNCESVEKRDNCTQCLNNTQGGQCESCKALFVGDPKDGGTCMACSDFCNKHTLVCMEKQIFNSSLRLPATLPLDHTNVVTWLKDGAKNTETTICINCKNNTQGDRCEECKTGYFRIGGDKNKTDPCKPCECNGHSAVCDKDKGTDCDCKNNTKSPHCDPSTKKEENAAQCWEQECSQCVENFLGTPTNGHQCYRQMSVDRDYCLDPTTQMNCNRGPKSLMWGRTVFFAVQPKYLNVDIRLILDITVGGVDVYFSPHFDTYNVSVEEGTGIHHILYDSKYKYEHGNFVPRVRRAAQLTSSDGSSNTSSSEDKQNKYKYVSKQALDFTTFVTLTHPHTFLLVRKVTNRLVITLPNDIHDLQTSRFYLVLKGVGSGENNETSGVIFFRQDQNHIDLFVFFSVFFSCFFLFLAFCVMLWKMKQAFDARISRHQRRLEMEHMASRPFAKALVLIEDPIDGEEEQAASLKPPSHARSALSNLTSKYSLSSVSPNVEEGFHINPLSLEPTDDGIAAVGTFIFQLPGSSSSPVQVCLASSLITMRVMYPHPHVHVPKTCNLRRRPSSSA